MDSRWHRCWEGGERGRRVEREGEWIRKWIRKPDKIDFSTPSKFFRSLNFFSFWLDSFFFFFIQGGNIGRVVTIDSTFRRHVLLKTICHACASQSPRYFGNGCPRQPKRANIAPGVFLNCMSVLDVFSDCNYKFFFLPLPKSINWRIENPAMKIIGFIESYLFDISPLFCYFWPFIPMKLWFVCVCVSISLSVSTQTGSHP